MVTDFRKLIATLAGAAAVCASAQNVLTSPDFSGMYRAAGIAAVARDAQHGWTYVSASGLTHLDGVQTRGAIARVDRNGFIDPDWQSVDIPDANGARNLMVSASGVLIADNGYGWSRAVRGGDGRYALQRLAAYGVLKPVNGADGVTYMTHTPSQGDVELRRLRADGSVDETWRRVLGDYTLGPEALSVDRDGNVTVLASHRTGSPLRYSITRYTAQGIQLWRHQPEQQINAIAVDEQARVYALTASDGNTGHGAQLLRIGSNGVLDPTWRGHTSPLLQPSFVSTIVTGDRVLLLGTDDTAATYTKAVQAVSTETGEIIARDTLPADFHSHDASSDGTMAVSAGAGVFEYRFAPAGGRSFLLRTLVAEAGGPPYGLSLVPWRDGFAVSGLFTLWHEGVRHDNLMRLDAALKPDPAWPPRQLGRVTNAAKLVVDAQGRLLVGGSFTFGPRKNLMRFAADGALDVVWAPNPDYEFVTLTAATDGTTLVGGYQLIPNNALTKAILARIRDDGSVDRTWGAAFPTTDPSANIEQLFDTPQHGTVVLWSTQVWQDGWPSRVRHVGRVARTAGGDDSYVSMEGGLPATNFHAVQDPASKAIFTVHDATGQYDPRVPHLLTKRLPGSFAADPAWPPLQMGALAFIVGFDEDYVYLSNAPSLSVFRVSKATGLRDATWGLPIGATAIHRVSGTSRNLLVDYYTSTPIRRIPLVAFDEVTRANAPRSVVEYYVRDLGHFFMTARANEQAALDALPGQFVRTGMQFDAVDAATEDASAPVPLPQPVCRFFAARETGGSATHFYGRKTDCQLLHARTRFRDEGYDFAAVAPIANACAPSVSFPLGYGAPLPVYRLFNNRAAQNDGNHRYVVSTARRDEMLARGWVDEGVAFCVTAVTDSRSFGSW